MKTLAAAKMSRYSLLHPNSSSTSHLIQPPLLTFWLRSLLEPGVKCSRCDGNATSHRNIVVMFDGIANQFVDKVCWYYIYLFNLSFNYLRTRMLLNSVRASSAQMISCCIMTAGLGHFPPPPPRIRWHLTSFLIWLSLGTPS